MVSKGRKKKNNIFYYFVDETGDTTLFNKKKKHINLDNNFVSKFFMLGVARIENPSLVSAELEELRQDLMNDPTLKKIPSMKKTVNFFHAKDDFQAVRREVFRLIAKHNIKINVEKIKILIF